MAEIRIGDKFVGDGHPCYVVAEVGINHNGDIDTAKQLIDVAVEAHCDAVKFQKRTIEVVYTPEELATPRESPFGHTNGDLKRGLEFGKKEYKEIDKYCKSKGITWFSSCWDEQAVDFFDEFDFPCFKIASAGLPDSSLLRHLRSKKKPLILATGMSTIEQIDRSVGILGVEDLILLHATSIYPSNYDELNLRVINTLRERYGVLTGYSGHEVDIMPSVASVALGACMVERHITLDRTMWGSDQSSSLEPHVLAQLIQYIRVVETALGDGNKQVYTRELPVLKKLRRVHS